MILGARWHGGVVGAGASSSSKSYKQAARSKVLPNTVKSANDPFPYIVEKLEEFPTLEVRNPEVTQLFCTFESTAVICIFNGLWPFSKGLNIWIYSNWTEKCEILLCSKGYFTICFSFEEEYNKTFEEGPWFWGRAGLFITPWFQGFHPNSMRVSKMPVWVKLPNLPLPLWHHEALEEIGNALGRYIKADRVGNK